MYPSLLHLCSCQHQMSTIPKVSHTCAEHPLVCIHTDICDKLPLGYGGSLFIDNYSCFTSIYFLKHRSEVLKVFIEFRTATKNFLNVSIVFLHDNAPEYIHGMFQDYCKTNSISYEKIVPDASPQNGISERGNGKEMLRVLGELGLCSYLEMLAELLKSSL